LSSEVTHSMPYQQLKLCMRDLLVPLWSECPAWQSCWSCIQR